MRKFLIVPVGQQLTVANYKALLKFMREQRCAVHKFQQFSGSSAAFTIDDEIAGLPELLRNYLDKTQEIMVFEIEGDYWHSTDGLDKEGRQIIRHFD